MAKVIAKRFVKAGNTVELFGSKDSVVTLGDIIVLAIPYDAVASVLEAHKAELAGKIIVVITNHVDFRKMESLIVPADSSASEVIAKAVPTEVVIKGFNTNFAYH